MNNEKKIIALVKKGLNISEIVEATGTSPLVIIRIINSNDLRILNTNN